MGKINLSGEYDDVSFIGFDNLSDDEIIYTLDRLPLRYQEYMGGKVKDWLKRRKSRAKTFFSKIRKKYKKLPKWAKIAISAPIVGLPLAAATFATGAAAKRSRRKTMSSKLRTLGKRRATRRAARIRRREVKAIVKPKTKNLPVVVSKRNF